MQPFPADEIKRQSGDNQKWLQLWAINSSHMFNKPPTAGKRMLGSIGEDIHSLLRQQQSQLLQLNSVKMP